MAESSVRACAPDDGYPAAYDRAVGPSRGRRLVEARRGGGLHAGPDGAVVSRTLRGSQWLAYPPPFASYRVDAIISLEDP